MKTTYIILDEQGRKIYENENYTQTLNDYQQLRKEYNYQRLIITTKKVK